MNRREQIIEKIYVVECSQRYNKYVKYRLEHFKRPAATKKIDYSCLGSQTSLTKNVSGALH